jgi:hypothetical protein
VRDIDTAVLDSLKVLDPKRPIREADIEPAPALNGLSAYDPLADISRGTMAAVRAACRWALWPLSTPSVSIAPSLKLKEAQSALEQNRLL